jgi:hypothetical protein
MDKHFKFFFFFLFSSLVISQDLSGAICKSWSPVKKVAQLGQRVSEASGMAFSSEYPQQSYYVNDSGSWGDFFISYDNGFDKHGLKKVNIRRYFPMDMEDLSLGSCPGGGSCIFIADTGDNGHIRPWGEIVLIKERTYSRDAVIRNARIFKRFRVKYPLKMKHNIEAMSVHPSGDIFLMTKGAQETHILKIPYETWQGTTYKQTVNAQYVATWKLSSLLSGNHKERDFLVTSMDISKDGKKFLVLTYKYLFEFNLDLSLEKVRSSSKMEKGLDFNTLPIKQLVQQEVVSYVRGSDKVMYSSESEKAKKRSKKEAPHSPLLTHDCLY